MLPRDHRKPVHARVVFRIGTWSVIGKLGTLPINKERLLMTKILSCAAVLGLLVASSSSVLAVDAVGAHAKVPVVAFADLRLVSNNSNRARAALYLAAPYQHR